MADARDGAVPKVGNLTNAGQRHGVPKQREARGRLQEARDCVRPNPLLAHGVSHHQCVGGP